MVEISLTGHILKSRYCIVEKIAEGGQGRIYLAKDIELGTLWAVKEMPAGKTQEVELFRLFFHPCIPRMVDYIEEKEHCYLVMEYIQGENLKKQKQEGRIFSSEEILKIGKELAGILKYLHSRKPTIVYGDMKPENLIFTEEGRLYLVDFGSAVLGYRREQEKCTGTKGYAAPEQYEGQMTPASDLYGFGKTILALMKGNRFLHVLSCPRLFPILFRCTLRKEKLRCHSAQKLEKQFSRLLERIHRKRGGYFYVLAGAAAALILSSSLFFTREGEMDFQTSLSQITESYYEKDFIKGKNRKKICDLVEKKLQRLLRRSKKEEQRHLLMLLAVNEECSGQKKRAEDYYRQLLLFEEEYRAAYEQYGIFLVKEGRKKESSQLWDEYKEKEARGILDGKASVNQVIWEEKLNEKTE